jgi:hypothetical protein
LVGASLVKISGQRLGRRSEVPGGRAGVHDAARLDQQGGRLAVGARAVRYAERDDEQFARAQHDVAVAQLDGELPVDDEEEFVKADPAGSVTLKLSFG